MAYIDELLGRGEKIHYVARQHLFVLVSHVLTEVALIALLVAAGVVANAAFSSPSLPTVGNLSPGALILLVCAAISVGVLISGFIDYLRWNTEQYIITDRRVIQVKGVLNKDVIDSSLDKINDVELSQTWMGRIFNYGTIEILTASDTGVNVMDRIGHPLDFKREMLEAKHQQDHYYVDTHAAAAYPYAGQPIQGQQEIQRTLEELAALRDRGILSSDEFENKKRELLSRI